MKIKGKTKEQLSKKLKDLEFKGMKDSNKAKYIRYTLKKKDKEL